MYIQEKKYQFGKVRKVCIRFMDKIVTPEASTLRKSIRLRRAELNKRRREILEEIRVRNTNTAELEQ